MSLTKASTVSTMVHQDRKGREEALISITPRRPRHFLYEIILSRIKPLTSERKGGRGRPTSINKNVFVALFFFFLQVAGERKLGNDMGERIPTEKVINFGKSSGGKEEASHLRKLDTSNEIPGKNYAREKSFSCLKTITRAEFQRRKASFEYGSEKPGESRGRRAKMWTKAREEKKRGDTSFRRFRSLENLSGNECRAKELEMSRKLREIHELVQAMQNQAKAGGKKEKNGGKAFSEWRTRASEDRGSDSGAREHLTFESRCNLNRKLVPIQFSTSFVTELGSRRKSFSEKILFKSVFIPSGDEEREGVFRSTMEVLYRPEKEMEVRKPYVFL